MKTIAYHRRRDLNIKPSTWWVLLVELLKVLKKVASEGCLGHVACLPVTQPHSASQSLDSSFTNVNQVTGTLRLFQRQRHF